MACCGRGRPPKPAVRIQATSDEDNSGHTMSEYTSVVLSEVLIGQVIKAEVSDTGTLDLHFKSGAILSVQPSRYDVERAIPAIVRKSTDVVYDFEVLSGSDQQLSVGRLRSLMKLRKP